MPVARLLLVLLGVVVSIGTLVTFVLADRQQRIERNLQAAASELVCRLNPPPSKKMQVVAAYRARYGTCNEHLKLHTAYLPAVAEVVRTFNREEAASHVGAVVHWSSSSMHFTTGAAAHWITRSDVERGYVLVRHGGNVYKVLSASLPAPTAYTHQHLAGYYSVYLQLGPVDRVLSHFVDGYG